MAIRASTPVFAILVALLAGFVLAGQASATHWSGQGTFGPNTTFQGLPTVFTFHMTNAASDSLDVYSVQVQFCWNSGASGYYFKADDGTSTAIAGGGSRDFSGTVDVSSTTSGACAVTIFVNGQAVGDLLRQTASYSASITVEQSQPILLYGLVAAVVIAVVVIAVLALRRKPRPPQTPPPPL